MSLQQKIDRITDILRRDDGIFGVLGIEDPTHSGCHLQEATSTSPALAEIKHGIKTMGYQATAMKSPWNDRMA